MSSLSFLPSVQHLIFDLGGVLYRLNFGAVERELARLQNGLQNVPTYTRRHQSILFLRFECGELSSQEFRDALRNELHLKANDEEIDQAWCSMLVGLYDGREEILRELRRSYTLVLLSNTNEIHLSHVAMRYPGLFSLFDQCFFSHELGMRKPDPKIFRHVLQSMNILPEESLFIEDSPQHIEGAQMVGMHTFRVDHPSSVELVYQLLLERSAPLSLL